MKLYVGNLTPTMTELELKKLFSNHAQVKNVHIITDLYTRQSKCFGYVEMSHKKDAIKVIEMLHGKLVNKQPLAVKQARSRDERDGSLW
jgi:RNA recognition motif-containing protein